MNRQISTSTTNFLDPKALRSILHAASTRDADQFNAVWLEFSSVGLALIATDGHRMASINMAGGAQPPGSFTFAVPLDVATVLAQQTESIVLDMREGGFLTLETKRYAVKVPERLDPSEFRMAAGRVIETNWCFPPFYQWPARPQAGYNWLVKISPPSRGRAAVRLTRYDDDPDADSVVFEGEVVVRGRYLKEAVTGMRRGAVVKVGFADAVNPVQIRHQVTGRFEIIMPVPIRGFVGKAPA